MLFPLKTLRKMMNENNKKEIINFLIMELFELNELFNNLGSILIKIRNSIPEKLILDVIDCRNVIADLLDELIEKTYPNQSYLTSEEKERVAEIAKMLSDLE